MSHKETVNKVLDQLINTIEEQSEIIRKLKEKNEKLDRLWMSYMNHKNDLEYRIFKLGYNPRISCISDIDTFKTLKEDPMSDELTKLYNEYEKIKD